MTGTGLAAAAAGVVMMVMAVPAGAQSLAEIAKKEADRRAAVATPGKVYTNDNLIPDFTTPPQPPPAAPEVAAAEPGPAPAGADPASVPVHAGADPPAPDREGVTPRELQESQPDDDKDEEFWRGQARLIRGRVADQNARIAGLRERASSFPPGAADAEKALVEQTLQKAIADLAYLNEEWLRFERSARERKIPDHWIR
jgi:hypothetical protein